MNKKFIPLAVLLVIVMCIISEYIGQKELMFPEVSALVISAWLTKKSTSQSLHFWLSPTLAAITGLLILKLFPYSPLFMIAGAFILVAIQLTFINSEIYPALSAAILPILLHTESWYYPLSVCIFTGIIACGKKIIYISSKKQNRMIEKASKKTLKLKFSSSNLIQWGALLICVLLVSAFALYFHWNYIVAPPLIVTFVELAKRNGKTKYNIGLIFISLVCASFLGTLCLYLICHVLHLPVWISAGLSVTCVLIAFYFLDFSWPPAAAIATLPVLVPAESLFMYPFEVLIGCFIFLLINLFWMKKTSLFKSTFSENLNKSIAK